MDRITVIEASQVAEARRRAAAAAQGLGFDEVDVGNVALAATELATNLLKHGGGGELLLDRREIDGRAEVELIALDRGAGMRDVETCLRDGYSTAGSPGNGLGAIRRLARSFGLYSRPGAGTVLLARIAARAAAASSSAPPTVIVGGISLPKDGEEVCGDAWCVERTEGGAVLMVADGLGHGPAAAEASRAAVTTFQRGASTDVARSVESIHLALRATRGAAVAATAFDVASGEMQFCGVGNIFAAVAIPGEMRRMISHNGTAGASARRIQAFPYRLPPGGAVIMASDGLATSWSLDRYPGLLAADPAIVAAVLYRDHNRGRDDVTVVVARRG